MDDSKKKINFDPTLLYYSTTNKNDEEETKIPNMNKETYNSTNRKHICNICGKRFFTNNSLNVHMEHHKPNEQTSTNDKEDDWKDRRLLNKGINCNKLECNFIALDAVEYHKHLTICEGKRIIENSNSAACCNKCETYFSSEDHLKAHAILLHPENCLDISLKENDTKQTISDPVWWNISETGNGLKNSRSMYPDSSVMKKKLKESDTSDSSPENCKRISLQSEDQIITNSSMLEITSSTITVASNTPIDCENTNSKSDIPSCSTDSDEKVNMKTSDDQRIANENSDNNIELGKTPSPDVKETSNGNSDANKNVSVIEPVDDAYNGVEKMMYQMFNDSGTSCEDDNNETKKMEVGDMNKEVLSASGKEGSHTKDAKQVTPKGVPVTKKSPDSHKKVKPNGEESKEVMKNSVKALDCTPLKSTQETKSGKRVTKDERQLTAEERKQDKKRTESPAKISANSMTSKTKDLKDTKSSPGTKDSSRSPNVKRDHQPIKKKYLKSHNGLEHSKSPVAKDKVNAQSTSIVAGNNSQNSSNKKVTSESPKKNRKREIATVPESSLLNERTVRSRKKLMLPDFEYGFDTKPEKDESPRDKSYSKYDSSIEKKTPKTPTDGIVRKRGRPRKIQSENAEVTEYVPVTKSMKTDKALETTTKSAPDGEQKEFALTTTISKAENHVTVSEVKTEGSEDELDELEDLWLKKIDFSEQSVLDAWDAPPKKKLGRPRKRKNMKDGKEKLALDQSTNESLKELNTDSKKKEADNNIPVVSTEKKKRGRPRKVLHDSLSHDVTAEILRVESVSSVVDTGETKKELNGPEKPNQQVTIDSKAVSKELTTPIPLPNVSAGIADATSKVTPTITPTKKRGRPRKSIENVIIIEDSAAPESTPEAIPETKSNRDDNISENETNLNKKREFLEYIRIKQDMDDPDFKPLGKKEDGPHSSTVMRKRSRRHRDESSVNASSAKNDRPYSIYNKIRAHSEKMLKRRRNHTPEILKIKRNKQHAESKPSDSENRSENEETEKTMSDSDTPKTESVSSEVDNEDKEKSTSELDNSEKVPPRSSKKLLKTKEKVTNAKVGRPSIIDTKDDETKNIDPDLYLADIRNRAKHLRVFKKITGIPNHDEYFPDSLITCGRCKKLMTLRHYYQNHQMSHYFISWIDGEKEIDLSDDCELIRIIQQNVNPDAVRKKWVRLPCEKCDKVMKSVVGYVSHVRFCSKMNEDDYLGTCVLCGKRLKPSSLRHHYVKFHDIPMPNVSAKTAEELILDSPTCIPVSRNEPSTSTKVINRNYREGFQRKSVAKTDIVEDEQFWTSLKTSYDLYMCMGLSCRHMTLSKDDLKIHIMNCISLFCEYSCLNCPYKTKYESEIIYHSKNSCKDTSDTEDKPEDNVDGRRVSTRVKKQKHRYGEETFDDTERKYEDDDEGEFVPSDDEDPDDQDLYTDDEDDDFIEKRSRFNKRKSDISSSVTSEEGLRQAFLCHSSPRNFDTLNCALEMRLKVSRSSPVLESLKVDINEWETFPVSTLPKHSPEQFKSMKMTFDGKAFVEYDLFQSDVVKGVPVSYTGGPVWAMAWAPLPAQVTEQYLAVGGLKHMNHLMEINSCVEFPSLIQIWKYSSLDNISNTIDKPALAWAIAHKFGAVWSMEWCPSGGYDASTTCRLGILALATSSGCVPVYSVPKLDSGGDSQNIVANPEPDLILKVKCENVQCTRIVWQRNIARSVIVGGFTDGTVALWDIGTTSSILKKGRVIFPYRTFEPHNAAIVALDAHWIENGRYLLTSSIDRVLKYWDLEDLSGPIYEHERVTPVTSVQWLHQWIVNAAGLDVSSANDANIIFCHPRDTSERKKTLSGLRDTFWSVSYSEWNDMIAFSSCGGVVNVYAAKHLSTLSYKQPDLERTVTETVLEALDDESKNENESVEVRTGLPETKSPFDCTSVIQNHALKFCDRVKGKCNPDKLNYEPDQSSVMSINKVCWNQNYNSFNWLAVGYECGIVRVFRVERFDKLHLTKFYKMNENNNIKLI